MPKKPWRVVPLSEETGRFTREQIEAAVRAVKERNEAKNEKRRSRGTRIGKAAPVEPPPDSRHLSEA